MISTGAGPFSFVPTHSIPPVIYCLEGRATFVFWANVLGSSIPTSNYKFTVTCSVGMQDDKRWWLVPTRAQAGSYSWTCEIFYNGFLVKTIKRTVVVRSLSSGNGAARKLLLIGDSTTAGGVTLSELANLYNTNSGAGMTLISITRSGTTATASTYFPHGLTTGDLVTITCSGEANFNVTGAAVTVTGTTRITGSNTFTYTVANTGNTTSSGTLTIATVADAQTITTLGSQSVTSVSDSGGTSRTVKCDAIGGAKLSDWWSAPLLTGTINGTTNTIANQFLSAVGQWDFTGYLARTNQSMSAGDWVMIHLGINDFLNLNTDDDVLAKTKTSISILGQMIAGIQAAVSGVKVGILLPLAPAQNQDAFAQAYSPSKQQWRYARNIESYREAILAGFLSQSNVFVHGYHANLDTENNMQTTGTAVNFRNTTTYVRQIDGLHPANSGYYQMADSIKCLMKGAE